MPRAYLTKNDKRDFQLVKNIRGRAKAYGLNMSDVAEHLGICSKTFYNRLNNPEDFTLGNLRDLAKILKISAEELQEAIV